MKRAFPLVACIALSMLILSSIAVAAPSLVGKWHVVDKGKDPSGNPCPYIPNEFEFFNDGTVAMDNLPNGMRMFYTTTVTPGDAKAIIARAPYVKDKNHILLMKPQKEMSWADGMPYHMELKVGEMYLTMPGWTASRLKKIK